MEVSDFLCNVYRDLCKGYSKYNLFTKKTLFDADTILKSMVTTHGRLKVGQRSQMKTLDGRLEVV